MEKLNEATCVLMRPLKEVITIILNSIVKAREHPLCMHGV